MLDLSLDRRTFLVGAGSLAGTLPFGAASQAAGVFHLRLMETTDLHVNVMPYDYYRDRPDDTVGLAKTATLIDQARAEVPNTLLFDNGDLLQGNPLGDYMVYKHGMKDGDVHPIIHALNTIGYDCATLGNHEFNYGLDFLRKCLAGARYPIVSANIYHGPAGSNPRKDKSFLKPYLILQRLLTDGTGQHAGIKIGVIGFVPPQIVDWDADHLAGKLSTRDIISTAFAYLPEMREAGADIIVALSHSGISTQAPVEGEENASFHLSQLPGIDVIFTGHAHQLFPGPDFAHLDGIDLKTGRLNGVPATMAGFWGSHLGLVDLMLMRDGKSWKVMDAQVQTRGIYKREGETVVPQVAAKSALVDGVKAAHEATLAYVREPVGKIARSVNSYFALVRNDPSITIVAEAQYWYVAPLIAKMAGYKDLPLLSAAAPFKAGGRGGADYYTDVPAGSIAIKNVADLYLYPNTVRAVAITGAQLKEWLERSAGIFRQIKPDNHEQALIDPSFPSYDFDVIFGVTYRIDVSQASRYDEAGKLVAHDSHRIVDLAYQGQPVDPTARFVVATNNYRAGGGGHFPGADGSTIILNAPDLTRDIIVRYIVTKGTVDPAVEAVWTFKPVPDATDVLFNSAPEARNHLGSVGYITYVGPGDNGFAKFRINLATA